MEKPEIFAEVTDDNWTFYKFLNIIVTSAIFFKKKNKLERLVIQTAIWLSQASVKAK